MNDYKSLHFFKFTHFYTPIPQVDVIVFFFHELPVKILLIKTKNDFRAYVRRRLKNVKIEMNIFVY